METPDRTLHKSEIIRGETTVSKLFAEGRGGFCHPFRYVFRVSDGEGVKILFSVPKKHFKRAVRRNLLKRRSREAYRLNKNMLVLPVAEKGKGVELALVYSAKEVHDFKAIQNGIRRILAEVVGRL